MSNGPAAPRTTRWSVRKGPAQLGVVMIVRNEAENLPALFETLVHVADEVVVVDTGSTDDTVAICEAWGVKVVREAWRDDFAHARNRSIAEASARYLLWLDGDDRLPPETQKRLCRLRDGVLPGARKKAWTMEVHSLNAAGEVFDTLVQARVFPRLPGVRFRHAIHEEVVSSLNEAGVQIARLDAVVRHLGYADAAVNQEKVRRNEALLRAELERDPDNFHARIHMAQTLNAQGNVVEAEREISEVIARVPGARVTPAFAAELHATRALYRRRMANELGAVWDLERAGELWPKWGLPYALLAEMRLARKDVEGCWAAVEKARGASFEATILSFPTVQARRNLEVCAGRILMSRGERAEGIACLLRALELSPGATRVRVEVGQHLLDAERYAEAREVLEPAGADESAVDWLVQVVSGIALARFATGDPEGAAACLSPLLTVFAAQLGGADDVGPVELAGAMLKTGQKAGARNMVALHRLSLAGAAEAPAPAAPAPERRSDRPAGYSFCIITNGVRPELLRAEIESIHRLGIPEYEILVAGDVPAGLEGVRVLPMPEAARAGRLGEMRNALCDQARFDRLVVADDDILFHEDFHAGLSAHGDDFDALSVRILNVDGTRFWDWACVGGPRGQHLLPYGEVDPYVYVTGGFIVLKAYVADRVRWDAERGFYQAEDVDFSRRLQAAGFRIGFCPTATVTHNDPRYTQRGEIVVRLPIPRVAPRWTTRSGAPVLGVALIVRDEERALPALLESLMDLADEVVVVDTGSTDSTPLLCRAWGVKLVQQAWRDDFSRARNRSLAECGAGHVLWLDADDRLPEATRRELRRLRDEVLPAAGDVAFSFRVHNLNRRGVAFDRFAQARLLPRLAAVRFRGTVAERVEESLAAAGVELRHTDLVVEHAGYTDPAAARAKVERNEALLRAAVEAAPADLHARVHLARAEAMLGRVAEAERTLSDALGRAGAEAPARLLAEVYSLRAFYRLRQSNRRGAAQDFTRAVEAAPGWAVPMVSLAGLCFDDGDSEGALALLERARGGEMSLSAIGGAIGEPRRKLELLAGRVRLARGERHEAVEPLSRALEMDPDDLDLRLELGQALLDEEEFARAAEVLEPAGRSEAALPRFVEVASMIGLARAGAGDWESAAACMAPLLDAFAEELGGRDEVDPAQLAEALLRAGQSAAAKNLFTLGQLAVTAGV